MFAWLRDPDPINRPPAFFDLVLYLVGYGLDMVLVGFIFGDDDIQLVKVPGKAKPLKSVKGNVTVRHTDEGGRWLVHVVSQAGDAHLALFSIWRFDHNRIAHVCVGQGERGPFDEQFSFGGRPRPAPFDFAQDRLRREFVDPHVIVVIDGIQVKGTPLIRSNLETQSDIASSLCLTDTLHAPHHLHEFLVKGGGIKFGAGGVGRRVADGKVVRQHDLGAGNHAHGKDAHRNGKHDDHSACLVMPQVT